MAKTQKEPTIKFPFDIEARELIDGGPIKPLTLANFRPYQGWMSNLCYEQEIMFLAAEMGLGKTGAVLWALVRLMDEMQVFNPLIIAPLHVAEDTWPDEIATWDFSRHLKYRVVTGTEAERIAALAYPADVTIINRENLVWLQHHLGSRQWPYDMLIYDEASRLKGGNKRTTPTQRKDGTLSPSRLSEFGILRQMRFKFKRAILLSGTPSPNGLIDLWGPIYTLDQGKRLGTSKTAFTERWFRQDRYTRKVEALPNAEGEIMDAVKDVFVSLREEDYLTLPPLIEQDHRVKMPPKAMEMYRRFEREFVLKEFDLEAVNGGVLTNKLLQFANGSLYLDDESATHVHDAKLDKLESIMAEAMGRPVLVAYSFKFDKDRIKKRFPYVRVYGEGKNDKNDWNAGRIKMMLTHPASAGHGLNLQHGGNIMVWYGLTWSLELYRQFIKRLHRQGQTASSVLLHRIITAGTADESVLAMLNFRGATQDRITEAVRVRVARVQAEYAYGMAA